MAYNVLSCDREQGYLMAMSLRDWLPEGDLAWFPDRSGRWIRLT